MPRIMAEIRVHPVGDGTVMYSARTRLNGSYVSGSGDTEEVAIAELRRELKGMLGAQNILPDGYPKEVEVEW